MDELYQQEDEDIVEEEGSSHHLRAVFNLFDRDGDGDQ